VIVIILPGFAAAKEASESISACTPDKLASAPDLAKPKFPADRRLNSVPSVMVKGVIEIVGVLVLVSTVDVESGASQSCFILHTCQ